MKDLDFIDNLHMFADDQLLSEIEISLYSISILILIVNINIAKLDILNSSYQDVILSKVYQYWE